MVTEPNAPRDHQLSRPHARRRLPCRLLSEYAQASFRNAGACDRWPVRRGQFVTVRHKASRLRETIVERASSNIPKLSRRRTHRLTAEAKDADTGLGGTRTGIGASLHHAREERQIPRRSCVTGEAGRVPQQAASSHGRPRRYARRLDVETPLVAFDQRVASHNDAIYKQLRDLGAPIRCYAVSAEDAIYGQAHDLRQILDIVVGSTFGTFLSCVPGRLAYFEGEPPNQRYVLERPASDSSVPGCGVRAG